MEITVQAKPVQEIIAAIQSLDLDPIKFKLMDTEEGHGWTRAQADHMEVEYKRFLTLLAKYPNASIAPSKSVDKFWHGHILDTLKYAEDCHKTFGYFLHHFPYFGMRGAQDAANLAAAAATMKELYEREFGAQTMQGASFCGVTNSAPLNAVPQDAAFCGAPNTASFCGATNTASFCGATPSSVQQASAKDSAFCGATNNVSFCGAPNTVSFCGATPANERQTAAQEAAFCGATPDASFCGTTNSVSFCGIKTAGTVGSILNTSSRPTLP